MRPSMSSIARCLPECRRPEDVHSRSPAAAGPLELERGCLGDRIFARQHSGTVRHEHIGLCGRLGQQVVGVRRAPWPMARLVWSISIRSGRHRLRLPRFRIGEARGLPQQLAVRALHAALPEVLAMVLGARSGHFCYESDLHSNGSAQLADRCGFTNVVIFSNAGGNATLFKPPAYQSCGRDRKTFSNLLM
jgi:hypothetical protein